MPDIATILPANATALERNIEQVISKPISVPVSSLWNADDIPENLLPWLAWANDVPVWNNNASIQERRALVAASIDLHRRRGTLSCFEDMARFTGAEVIRAITPPAKTFCAASTTQSERNAFLNRMPQLRLFKFRNKAKRAGAMAWKDFPVATSGYGMFPVQSTAAARLGTTAFIHGADGTDTPLTVIDRSTQSEMKDVIETQEVREHSNRGLGTFAGGFVNWLTKSTASSRLYNLRLVTPYIDSSEVLHKRTIEPSMQPVDIHYDTVAETGSRAGLFLGGSFVSQFFRKTNAADRLYKRLYLFDKAQTLESRGMSTHLGGTRMGMKPHNAEIHVQINGRRSIRAAGRFISGYLLTAPREAYSNTMTGLRFAKRLTDRVLIQTATKRIIRSSSTIKAGEFIAGQRT